MKNRYHLIAITTAILLAGGARAGSVTIPNTFTSGTPAKASEVNANFSAVETAVDDNDARITDQETNKQNRVTGTCSAGTSIRSLNADGSVVCDTALSATVQENYDLLPAVKTVEDGGGVAISSSSTEYKNITVTVPAAGKVIVFASGSIYLNVATASAQLIRVKVSNSTGDTSESPGIQFIRSPNVTATGPANVYPFSIVKVFDAPSAGSYTYYLNMWHQVGSGSASAQTDDLTLTALYIPKSLP